MNYEHLKPLHDRLLEMLIEFDRFCRQHEIIYWLDGGTLIGALRTGDFVPWDDDIDVAMPAPDFAKFIDINKQGDSPANMSMRIGSRYDNFPDMVTLADNNSHITLVEKNVRRFQDIGAFICVFNIYTLKHPKSMAVHDALARCVYGMPRPKNYWLRQLNSLISRRFALKYPLQRFAITMLTRAKFSLDDADLLMHSSCDNYADLPWHQRFLWKKDDVFPLLQKEIAGHKFPVQKNFHAYLTALYGMYYAFPPVAERAPKHVRFYELFPSKLSPPPPPPPACLYVWNI